MPEGVNCALTNALSDMLFTTEETANQHLRNEGITTKIFFVGNMMVDALLKHHEKAIQTIIFHTLGLHADQVGSSGKAPSPRNR